MQLPSQQLNNIAGNVSNRGILQVGGPATEAATMSALTTNTRDSLTINGDLVNSGRVQISGATGVPGNRLVVNGDYTGDNGHLAFRSVLGDDTSLTDHMTVTGDTRGTTHVSVTNAGGEGAQTLEGIELIRVGGNSDGKFVQDGRIVAGAYDYTLMRGEGENTGNWYLTSLTVDGPEGSTPEVQYRPKTGSYLANSQAANTLFMTRLDDRPG